MDIRDIEIEAPWGMIAIKLWGNQDDPAVLAVHGKMDNAGTFDAIIPLLPKYFYICVDLPGHGKSSHFPPHLPIHTINYLLSYTIVMDYFKKDKYIIMGHSYGAQLGLLFSQVYPERVEKLIMFDAVHIFPIPSKYIAEYIAENFEKFMQFEKKLKTKSAPQYTYKEAYERVMQVRPSPLTEHAAKNILKRMLRPVGNNKFELTLDQRLKFFMNPLHDNQFAVDILKESPLKCSVLIVFGLSNRVQRHVLRPILNYLKKQKNVSVKFVPGDHDVHSTDADLVAPHVIKFLNFQKSKI